MNRGQRSPGMYACPKPNSSPLPEYSIELRFVAPIASATAAIPVFWAQPATRTVRPIQAVSTPSIRAKRKRDSAQPKFMFRSSFEKDAQSGGSQIWRPLYAKGLAHFL